MESIGSFEAKTQLSSLLERVSKGETIQITKRGVPVARLVPVGASQADERREAVRLIREERKGVKLRGLKIRELIEHGRRY